MSTFANRQEAGFGICARPGCDRLRVSKWHSYCLEHRREIELKSRLGARRRKAQGGRNNTEDASGEKRQKRQV